MAKNQTNDVVVMLLVKEIEISNRFHNAITEILRLGYDTERGEKQIPALIESVQYYLEEIERIVSR